MVSSVFTSAGGTAIGFYILSSYNLDTSGGNIFGLDPFVFLGLGTIGFGALGWLVGPSMGNAVFGLIYRRHAKQMAQVFIPFHFDVRYANVLSTKFIICTNPPSGILTQF